MWRWQLLHVLYRTHAPPTASPPLDVMWLSGRVPCLVLHATSAVQKYPPCLNPPPARPLW